MATQEPTTKDGITGTVMLYRQPEPLSAERHGRLGLMRDGEHLAFARTANYVPLVGAEFIAASADYPIVFAGDKYSPVVVMGLREGENAFIRGNGSFEPHVYAPSYLRRYPFVLASHPDGRSLVCIDRAMETIREDGDIPFFENGQPSAFTREGMGLLQAFEEQRLITERMVEELRALDLFEAKVSHYTPPSADRTQQQQPVPIAQFTGISEEKLVDLPAETLKDLQRKGYLPLIYAHLISLNNWQKLITRSVERGFLPAMGQPEPAQKAS